MAQHSISHTDKNNLFVHCCLAHHNHKISYFLCLSFYLIQVFFPIHSIILYKFCIFTLFLSQNCSSYWYDVVFKMEIFLQWIFKKDDVIRRASFLLSSLFNSFDTVLRLSFISLSQLPPVRSYRIALSRLRYTTATQCCCNVKLFATSLTKTKSTAQRTQPSIRCPFHLECLFIQLRQTVQCSMMRWMFFFKCSHLNLDALIIAPLIGKISNISINKMLFIRIESRMRQIQFIIIKRANWFWEENTWDIPMPDHDKQVIV